MAYSATTGAARSNAVVLKGYRKYTVVMLVILTATGMLIWGKLTGAEFVQVVTWVSGLFFGVNGAQSVGVKIAERPAAKPATVIPSPPAVQIDARSQG